MSKETKYFLPKWYWRNPYFEISGWEGYVCNKYGVVKSCKRMVDSQHGSLTRTVPEKILPWYISTRGYARVILSQKPKKCKKVSVHRIVASIFHKETPKMPSINHEDGNKLNNYYKNLLPCTNSYNQQHACDTGLLVNKKSWEDSQSKPVMAKDLKGNEVATYGSMAEASSITGIGRTSIRRSCNEGITRRWPHNLVFSFLNQ